MEKYIETINEHGCVDRYHIQGATVDDFIEVFLVALRDGKLKVRDITESEFEGHKNRKHSLIFNVENRWTARHYKPKHSSKYWERKWNRVIAQ
jgi:hypothetical protein